jgi:hypothetical protein
MNKYYCAFHILTGEYVYCHDLIQKTATTYHSFLLPLGANYDYDSSTVMLRFPSSDKVYSRLRRELDNFSFLYKDHCIEEFEIHEFSEKLVPLQHRWKEYHINTGQIKDIWER